MANYLLGKGSNRPTPPTDITSKDKLIEVDPMYKMQLYTRSPGKKDIKIEGFVPSNFSFSMESGWEPLVANGSIVEAASNAAGGALGAGIQIGAGVSGTDGRVHALTAQKWSGGSYLTFSLPFKISAYNDTETEIMEPMRNILKLAAPSVDLGVLTAPGPRAASFLASELYGSLKDSAFGDSTAEVAQSLSTGLNQALKHQELSLIVGKFFKMKPCVVDNVEANFESLFEHGSGNPIAVSFDLTIKSYLLTTQTDIDAWLGG